MRASARGGTLGAFIAFGGWEHDAMLELFSERSTLEALFLAPLREIVAAKECAADDASVIAVAFSVLASVVGNADDVDSARAARAFVAAGGREVLIEVLQRHRTSRSVVAGAAPIVRGLRLACADAAATGTPFEAWGDVAASASLVPAATASRRAPAVDETQSRDAVAPVFTAARAASVESPLAPLPAILSVATALYTCTAESAGDLDFMKGDTLIVTRIDSEHWWFGARWDATQSLPASFAAQGVFPSNYVEEHAERTSEVDGLRLMLDASAISRVEHDSMVRAALTRKRLLPGALAGSPAPTTPASLPSAQSRRGGDTATARRPAPTGVARVKQARIKTRRSSVVKLRTDDGLDYYYDDPKLGGTGGTAWDVDALGGAE